MIIENQKVYYRFEDDKVGQWKILPSDIDDLNEWCLKQLRRFEYQDSDGDYTEHIELDIDGKRYFALANFNGWGYDDDADGENISGSMWSFSLVSATKISEYDRYIKPSKYSPHRDYIFVQSWNFRSLE